MAARRTGLWFGGIAHDISGLELKKLYRGQG